MNFRKHSGLEGAHAFLSPSKYHWINYDEEKLGIVYWNWLAAQRGTELHDFAKRCINLRIKLPKTNSTLNMYVNDAIGYRMTPEQGLFYSENCFGTADAISFDKNFLRIHDLKTGMTKPSFSQLEAYAAIFCLEYNVDPRKIDGEFRIYYSNDKMIQPYDPERIIYISDKIVSFDKQIDKMKAEW